MKKPTVSVIIPAYNEEAYIGECLDSLLRQEVLADEIIIVENNSTDNTIKAVKKYPIRLIKERKQGMIPARNRGFDEAKYEILARTDADTILPPDWIKRIKMAFAAEENLVALSGPGYFHGFPDLLGDSDWMKKFFFSLFIPYGKVLKRILKHDWLYGPNMAIRKNAWQKIKHDICLNDSDVHEDIDLAIHIASMGKIKFDKNLVVSSSFRRWRRLDLSYFEYPYRGLKSIQKHNHLVASQKGMKFVKKLISKALFN